MKDEEIQELIVNYEIDQMYLKDLVKKFNVSKRCIKDVLEIHGITIRHYGRGGAVKKEKPVKNYRDYCIEKYGKTPDQLDKLKWHFTDKNGVKRTKEPMYKCNICGINKFRAGEKYCATCRKKYGLD